MAKRWIAGMVRWYDARAYRGRQHLEGV
jgi:hypothetical protein